MSRRVYLLGVGITLVALVFVVTDALLGACPGVTAANVRRVRPGMTEAEVTAILGPPSCLAAHEKKGYWVRLWLANEAVATVRFDDAGLVQCAWFDSIPPLQPGPLARLRAWLGW